MSFLEDLVNVNLTQGEEIKPSKSLFRKILNREDSEGYQLFFTEAGMPLVLPCNEEGELYQAVFPKGALLHQMKPLKLPFGFRLANSDALIRGRHYFKAEKILGKPIKAKFTYEVELKHGKIFVVNLNYLFDLKKSGDFQEGGRFHVVYPERSTVSSTNSLREDLPEIEVDGAGRGIYEWVRTDDFRFRKDETATFKLLEGWSEPIPINYDETLRNFVKIMLKEKFTREDFGYLHRLEYLVFM